MTQPLSAQRNESEEPGPVSLRFRFDSETVEQFAERYATDVSRGGIFVQSRQPFAVGTQLRLDLQLLNGTPLITGEGTVHWTRELDPAKPNTVPGMGIRFNKLSTRSQQVIEMVLSQRTGKQRTGLFSQVMPAVPLEESQKILHPPTPHANANPKSKLPFNVFPGRPHDPSKPSDDRELLATAGREEATPVVEATAAHLADARPGKDELASVKTPPPAAPLPEVGSGSAKRPPLSLIRPEAGAPSKEVEKAVTESARTRRSSGSSKAAPLPPPPVTTTQEISPSGSTPPAPVQGEPALGASQSGVPVAIGAMPSAAAAAPSVRPSNRGKLIFGAAALLAASLTVFAVTRSGSKLDASAPVAHAPATNTAPAPAAEPSAPIAALPPATGTAPTETAPEANSGPAVEPEAPSAPSTSGSSKSSGPSRVADRRSPKGKTVVAHRESQPASRPSSSAPAERPVVAEAPAPHVEAPAPAIAPPPPPPPVAHVEPPPAPKPVHTEPAPAPKPAPVVALPAAKPAAPPTSPPPVTGGILHKLRMTSIPSEAEVEIDGKSVGRTPLFGVEVDVSQPHQLVVKKDGFVPFKQTISRGSEWNVRPSENTATLRISALMKKQ